jgi:hypothetical protein
MNVAIFWHVTPCSLVAVCRLLKRLCCLPLYGIRIYVCRIIWCQFKNTTILILKFNVDVETVLISGFRYINIDTNLRQIKLSLSRSRIHRGRSRCMAPLSLNLVARWRCVVDDILWPFYRRKKPSVPIKEWRWGRARGSAQSVKALRYKPERCGFDSRWCHWKFSST